MRWRERHPQLMRLLFLNCPHTATWRLHPPGTEKTESPTAVPLQTPVPPTATPQPTPTLAPTPTPRDTTPQEIYRRVSPAVVRSCRGSPAGGGAAPPLAPG